MICTWAGHCAECGEERDGQRCVCGSHLPGRGGQDASTEPLPWGWFGAGHSVLPDGPTSADPHHPSPCSSPLTRPDRELLPPPWFLGSCLYPPPPLGARGPLRRGTSLLCAQPFLASTSLGVKPQLLCSPCPPTSCPYLLPFSPSSSLQPHSLLPEPPRLTLT